MGILRPAPAHKILSRAFTMRDHVFNGIRCIQLYKAPRSLILFHSSCCLKFIVNWNFLEREFCSVSLAEQSKNTWNNSTTHHRDVSIPHSLAFIPVKKSKMALQLKTFNAITQENWCVKKSLNILFLITIIMQNVQTLNVKRWRKWFSYRT